MATGTHLPQTRVPPRQSSRWGTTSQKIGRRATTHPTSVAQTHPQDPITNTHRVDLGLKPGPPLAQRRLSSFSSKDESMSSTPRLPTYTPLWGVRVSRGGFTLSKKISSNSKNNYYNTKNNSLSNYAHCRATSILFQKFRSRHKITTNN
jgi:hypothetical protein